jgi:hypothetical protein
MVSEVSTIKAGAAPTGGGYLRLPLAEIHHDAPGRHADKELTASIKKFGVLQPLLVARQGDRYELLAGSRRLDAARAAGLADVPVLVIAPDRAGALDVYLEENLARRELSEPDRINLRDRWMRETGRDLEQAESRIPEIQWEATTNTAPKKPNIWFIAAGVMAVVSTILLLIIFNTKPVDRRPVVIPVEFVEAPPPAPVELDMDWMESFGFPGHERNVIGNRLELSFAEPIMSGAQFNARANIFLNQLAAIMLETGDAVRVRIIADTATAAASARRLIDEGLAPGRIAIQPAYEGLISFELVKE